LLAVSPSLSHTALPFPTSEALSADRHPILEHFGINLGALTWRGEQEVLTSSLDALLRATSNPFFPEERQPGGAAMKGGWRL
jgi:hypothetical protein